MDRSNDRTLTIRTVKEDFIDSIFTDGETLKPAIVGHCVTSACLPIPWV